MNRFFKVGLPWIVAAIFAIAFASVLISHRTKSDTHGSSQKKVLYWVDAMNPSHKYDKAGKAPDGMDLVPVYAEGTSAAAEKKILYWVDPMHPAYKSDKPGIAPDCGMQLVPVYADGSMADTSASYASMNQNQVKGYAPVTLSEEKQQLIGVKTGMVEVVPMGSSVRAVGRVALDETRLHTITTKFDGYIERLYVDFTGKEIRRGQPLLSIYSPELLASQQEYLLAYRGKKQLENASSEIAASGDALYQSAKQRLLLWDMTPSQIRQLERTGVAQKSVTIYAPVSGFVQTKSAIAGAKVAAGQPLFDIASLDRVWVVADVYESEVAQVKLGNTASVTAESFPGRTWNGRVSFIAPSVDPMTRTLKVRVDISNGDGALKPDMFANVGLAERGGEVTAVPDSAVLQTGTRSIVFLAKGKGIFEPREITTGQHANGWWEVKSGVEPGDEVVLQANFLIDSESRLRAAVEQTEAPHAH